MYVYIIYIKFAYYMNIRIGMNESARKMYIEREKGIILFVTFECGYIEGITNCRSIHASPIT